MNATKITAMLSKAEEEGREYGASLAEDAIIDHGMPLKVAYQICDDLELVEWEVPEPLSGEWAGESIVELSARFGVDLSDDEVADTFTDAFNGAYFDWVLTYARKLVHDDTTTRRNQLGRRGATHFAWLLGAAIEAGNEASFVEFMADTDNDGTNWSCYPEGDDYEFLRESWNGGFGAAQRSYLRGYFEARNAADRDAV